MTQVPQQPIHQKTEPIRDEAYRRHVASQPCRACGVLGHSQAAHISHGNFARGMKAGDDLCKPFCGPRPGYQGCHSWFDKNQTVWVRKELDMTIDELKTEAREDYGLWKVEGQITWL